MLFSEREPSPSKYKYKRFGDETVNLYNCRSLSDCSFVHVTHAQLLFSSVFATHSRLQRLRSIWPAPWIETSGRLQSVLVTDWSDANTIKSDKPEKKHEAWRKDNNKPNFCGNMRLQGKYYKQKPSVRFTWKAMKEGIGRALEIFSLIKISLAIVCHLERAELTKLQEVLKMVLRSKAQKELIIRSKRGNTVQESPSSTTSPGVGSEKKKEQGQLLGTYVTQIFLLIKLMFNV